MKTLGFHIALGFLTAASMVHAEIIVDHSLDRFGGWESDTALRDWGGNAFWTQDADDVMLTAAATIEHVAYWGFYFSNTPPASETMRIRFYDARPSDGLPGNVVAEQVLVNPIRGATDVVIENWPPGSSGTASEYRYDADLSMPLDLAANTKYWFEVVQVGDLDSCFEWRASNAEQNGTAFRDQSHSIWQLDSYPWDRAFRLEGVPEPASLTVLVLGFLLLQASAGKAAKWR